MTQRSDLLQLLVHPHQIEVQEFDSYDLIVDLREPADWAHDHIPGAVNIPWVGAISRPPVSSDRPIVGRSRAAELSVEGPAALRAQLASQPAGATVLLYSGDGGAGSAEAADAVAALGLTVDLIAGGWPTYRRWVSEGLRSIGSYLKPRWIRSVPCGLSQAVLQVLQQRGEQVCCFASVVGSGPLPGLLVAGDSPVSQDAFDTRLLDVLRRHDPSRTVWCDEVHHIGSTYRLPADLMFGLHGSAALRPVAPLRERVRLVRQHLQSLSSGPTIADGLGPVLALVDATLASEVRQLMLHGRVDDCIATLLSRGTDLLIDEDDAERIGERSSELCLALETIEPSAISRALLAAVPQLQDAAAGG